MIGKLEHEMRKISVTKQTFQYKQNNNEFLSILIVFNARGLNASLSVAFTPLKDECPNSNKINSIIKNQRKFSDGTSFESHFREDQKIGKV